MLDRRQVEKIREKAEEKGRLVLLAVFLFSFLLSLLLLLPTLPGRKRPEEGREKNLGFDFSLFEKEEFKNLEVFEGATAPGEKGRENPFLPPEEEKEEREEGRGEERGEEAEERTKP